jgi:NADH-quinone oxidoreductase subunit D
VRRDIPEGFIARLSQTLDYLESRLPDYDNLMFTNQVFVKRARDIGTMNQAQALEWGVTGPNLRATGLAFDVRRDDPYLIYDELEFDIAVEHGGDAWARALVRRKELQQSIRILRQVADRLPGVAGPIRAPIPNPLAWNVPKGDAYVRTESSKGELAWYVVSNGGAKPYRTHVRGPSSMHAVQVLEYLVSGARIEDVAQIMFSLDACPPEVDR